MKSSNANRIIGVGLASIILIVLAIVFGCDHNTGAPEAVSPLSQAVIDSQSDPELLIEVISASDCKTFDNLAEDEIPQNQTALEWEYDGQGTLIVRHLNAVLDAAPEHSAYVYLNDREITIQEVPCPYCFGFCLKDIEYRITGLPNGKFLLHVTEILGCPEDPPLEVEVLLKGSGSSGQVIFERTCAPWVEAEPPEGTLIYHTGCSWENATAADGLVPTDSNCIIYEYDNNGVLLLEHQNAVFNCCIASMVIEFAFSNDTIYIHEDETYGEWGPCACVCPYTVYMQVVNLLPGEYTIVLEGRAHTAFHVDLLPGASGYHCFEEALW